MMMMMKFLASVFREELPVIQPIYQDKLLCYIVCLFSAHSYVCKHIHECLYCMCTFVCKCSSEYRIHSKNLSPLVQQKFYYFGAIRAGTEKTAEGDEYLDFSDETLERRQIIERIAWHRALPVYD